MFYLRVNKEGIIQEALDTTETPPDTDFIEVAQPIYDIVYASLASGVLYRYLDGDIFQVERNEHLNAVTAVAEIHGAYTKALRDYQYVLEKPDESPKIIKVNDLDFKYLCAASCIREPIYLQTGEGLDAREIDALLDDMLRHRNRATSFFIRYSKMIHSAQNRADIEKHVTACLKQIGELNANTRNNSEPSAQ